MFYSSYGFMATEEQMKQTTTLVHAFCYNHTAHWDGACLHIVRLLFSYCILAVLLAALLAALLSSLLSTFTTSILCPRCRIVCIVPHRFVEFWTVPSFSMLTQPTIASVLRKCISLWSLFGVHFWGA